MNSSANSNPNVIEERVVEMRIDNDKFEDGARKTIGILEKLQEALHLHAETDEIDKLQNAVGGFDVSPMADGLDKIQAHFSALEVAGMRVISNLTDSIYNFAATTLKSFTIDPVAQGFGKFGEKTTAVATLQAQGYELEKVNSLMEQLNWFTDETSYNFTDMVGNIAKFTATGQDLDESVTAMEGIALWAALSGQNAQKASLAMYQLSQAMGKGALKLDDFKSIQNASMDTQEFRRQAVAAAEALGVLKRVGEDAWQTMGGASKAEEEQAKALDKLKEAQARLNQLSVNGTAEAVDKQKKKVKELEEAYEAAAAKIESGLSLSELFSSKGLTEAAWFTSDVMMEVFNQYSKAVSEIRRFMDDTGISTASVAVEELENAAKELADMLGITLDEAFQQLGYDIDEFSIKAFKAGQQARTWTDVVDSVKDAVSTGWMTTFETIIGDAEKATTFWTNLANGFWDLFASGAERRNAFLKAAGEGTSDIKRDTSAIKEIYEEIKSLGVDISQTVFGNIDTNSRQILSWTKDVAQASKDALTSWGTTLEEMEGSISTVFGGWEFFDDLKIAFSPILQTNDGPQLLNRDTVMKYIGSLIDELKQKGKEWTDEDLFRLDARGLEVDGIQIKNILAAIGDEADKVAEAMHYVGKDGALAQATKDINMQEYAWSQLESAIEKAGFTQEEYWGQVDKWLRNGEYGGIQELIDKYGSLKDAFFSATSDLRFTDLEYPFAMAKDSLSQYTDEFKTLVDQSVRLEDQIYKLAGSYGRHQFWDEIWPNGENWREIEQNIKSGSLSLEDFSTNINKIYTVDWEKFQNDLIKSGHTIEEFEKMIRDKWGNNFSIPEGQTIFDIIDWHGITDRDAFVIPKILEEFGMSIDNYKKKVEGLNAEELYNNVLFGATGSNAWEQFSKMLNNAGYSVESFRAVYEELISTSEDEGLQKLIEDGVSLEDAFRSGIITGDLFQQMLERLTGTTKETASVITSSSDNITHTLEEYKALIPGILSGEYGNGEERKAALEAMGYNYEIAQKLAEWKNMGYSTDLENLAKEFPTLVEMIRDEMVATGNYTETEIEAINQLLAGSDTLFKQLQKDTGFLADGFGSIGEEASAAEDNWQLFLNGITNFVDSIVSIKETITDAFDTVFGDVETRGRRFGETVLKPLGKLSERLRLDSTFLFEDFENMSDEAERSRKVLGGIHTIFTAIFSVVKVVSSVIGVIADGLSLIIQNGIWVVEKIIGALDGIFDGEAFATFFSTLLDGATLLITPLNMILDALDSIFSFVGMVAGGVLTGAFYALKEFFTLISGGIVYIYDYVSNLDIVQTLINDISVGIGKFNNKLKSISDLLKTGFLRDSFKGILENLLLFAKINTQVKFPRLSKSIGNLKDRLSELEDRIISFYTNLKENFSFKTLIETILSGIYSIPELIGSGFKGLGELAALALGGLLSIITNIVHGLTGIDVNMDGLSEKFQKFYNYVEKIFTGLFGDPEEIRQRITTFFTEAWNGLIEAAKGITIRDALKALRLAIFASIAAKIMSVLSTIKYIGQEAQSITGAISGSITKFGDMFKDIGMSFRADAVIKMAIALGVVAVALYGLTKIDENKLLYAASVISVIMLVLTLLANSIRKQTILQDVNIKNLQVFGTLGSALIGFGIAVAAFARAVFKIASIENPDRLIVAGNAIGQLFLGLGILVGIFALAMYNKNMNSLKIEAMGKAAKKFANSLLIISIAINNLVLPILLFTAAIAILNKIDGLDENILLQATDIVKQLMLGLTILIGAFALVLIFAKNEAIIKSIGNAILKMSASMILMATAINGLVLPILLITAAFAYLSGNGKDQENLTGYIISAVNILTQFFTYFALFIVAVTALTIFSKASEGKIKALGTMFLKIGAAILLIAVGLKVVVNAIIKAVRFAAMLNKLEMSVDLDKFIDFAKKLAIGLGIFVGALAVLSMIPWVNSGKLLALAGAIAIFSVALWIMVPALLSLISACAGIANTLKDIENLEIGIERLGKIASIVLVISAAALIFGVALAALGVGALASAVALVALSAGFYLLAKAVDTIISFSDKLIELLKKLWDYLSIENVGKVLAIVAAIGVVVIGILAIGKAIRWVLTALRLMPTAERISGYFKELGKSVGKSVPSLIRGFGTKIKDFFTNNKSLVLQFLNGLIVIIGAYLIGIIPTLTDTVLEAITVLLSSIADSVETHRDQVVESITKIIDAIIAVAEDVLSHYYSKDNWEEAGLLEKILLGAAPLALVDKLTKAFTGGQGLFTVILKKLGEVSLKFLGFKKIVKETAEAASAIGEGANAVGGAGGSGAGKVAAAGGGVAFGIAAAIAAIFAATDAIKHGNEVKEKSNEIAENLIKESQSQEDRIKKLTELIGPNSNSYFNEDVWNNPNSEASKKAMEMWQARAITAEALMQAIAQDEGLYLSSDDWKILKKKYLDGNRELTNDELEQLFADIHRMNEGEQENLVQHLMGWYDLTREYAEYAAKHFTIEATTDPIIDNLDKNLAALSELGISFTDVIDKSKELGISVDETIQKLLASEPAFTEVSDAIRSGLIAIMDDETLRKEIEESYPEIGKLIDAAIANELDLSSVSDELQKKLLEIGQDETLMAAIEAKYPEFGSFIDAVIAGNLDLVDTEKALADALAETADATEVKDTVNESYSDIGEDIDATIAENVSLDETKEALTEKLVETADASGLKEQIEEKYPEVAKIIDSAVAGNFDLSNLTDKAKEELGKIPEDAELKAKIDESFPALGALIDNAAAGNLSLDTFKNTLMGAFTKMFGDSELLNSIYGDMNGLSTFGLEGMGDGLENFDILDPSIMDLGNYVPNEFQDIWEINSPSKVFKRIAAGIPEGIALGLADNGSLVYYAIKHLVDLVNEPFNGIQDIFKDYGVQTVRGVTIGINSNISIAYNAGVNLADAVNRGFTDTLKINSPSRVFMDLAKYIPEGIAVGIDHNSQSAIESITVLSDDLIKAANYAMSRVGIAASDEFEFDSRIVPVIEFPDNQSSYDMNFTAFSDAIKSVGAIDNLRLNDVSNQNRSNSVVNAVNDLGKRMDRFTKSLDEDRNFNVDIRVDQMAVRDESDIRAISKQLAKEVRVALRQKGTR